MRWRESEREGGGLLEVDDGSWQGTRDWSHSQGGLDNLALAGRSWLTREGTKWVDAALSRSVTVWCHERT